MQEESLKTVSNSSSCHEQTVGRKCAALNCSLSCLILLFPTVIPFSAWFSTPLPRLTRLFLISPSFHPQEDGVRTQLDIKLKLTQRWPTPFTGVLCPFSPKVSPLQPVGAPGPHPGWATGLLFLFCYSQPKDKSGPREAQGHPSPAGVWEHNQGLSISHGKRTNAPDIFPSPFGAERLFC